MESLLREAMENDDISGLRDAVEGMDTSLKQTCLLRAVLWEGRDAQAAKVAELLLSDRVQAYVSGQNLLLEAVRKNKPQTIRRLIELGGGNLLNVRNDEREEFIQILASSTVATKRALLKHSMKWPIIDLSPFPVKQAQARVDCSRLQFAALRDLNASPNTLDAHGHDLQAVLVSLNKWEEANQWPEVYGHFVLRP